MNIQVPYDIIHANFIFIDTVGLSDPTMSTETQTNKIKFLNKSILECPTFKNTHKNEVIVLPTGDGMAIGFKRGIDSPIKLAIELQKRLFDYNKNTNSIDQICVRIGCHSGDVFTFEDLCGKKNHWGPGLILARRIMDLGDSNHILMSNKMAENLMEITDKYDDILHRLPNYQIKHNVTMDLYSVYDQNFGNSKYPTRKTIEQSNLIQFFDQIQKAILFNAVQFDLILKDPEKQLIKHIRTYSFVNDSKEPIYEIMYGITTKIEKKFAELNVSIHDKDTNKKLKISNVNASINENDFIIKFDPPVFQGEKKTYVIEYMSEEPQRYYENYFLVNSQKFDLTFTFPTNAEINNPHLYIMHGNNIKEKKIVNKDPYIKRGVSTLTRWSVADGVSKDDIIRLEW